MNILVLIEKLPNTSFSNREIKYKYFGYIQYNQVTMKHTNFISNNSKSAHSCPLTVKPSLCPKCIKKCLENQHGFLKSFKCLGHCGTFFIRHFFRVSHFVSCPCLQFHKSIYYPYQFHMRSQQKIELLFTCKMFFDITMI